LLDLVDTLERPAAPVPAATRPAPTPPVAARPARLSATAVETLIRDPYAIYARHVLRLEELPPLGIEIDARLRGEVLHTAFERFCRATALDWPADPLPLLHESLAAAMAEAPLPRTLQRLWRARLDRLAPLFLREEAARRAAGAPVAFEVKGRREGHGFTLTARADRIDRQADGSLALYDYKTGQIPSDKEIKTFAKQLPLMAAIAAAGGFEGLDPAPVSVLAHVSLGGGRGAGAERRVAADDPDGLGSEAWAGLMRLVAAFRNPGLGYLARARPRLLRHPGPYDHLSRLGEWEDGSDG
jgi:ATP-dependent helicase/nuclease subunit B